MCTALWKMYPPITGRRPLKTPSFIKALFSDDNVVVARAPNVGVGAGARFGGMGPDPQVPNDLRLRHM